MKLKETKLINMPHREATQNDKNILINNIKTKANQNKINTYVIKLIIITIETLLIYLFAYIYQGSVELVLMTIALIVAYILVHRKSLSSSNIIKKIQNTKFVVYDAKVENTKYEYMDEEVKAYYPQILQRHQFRIKFKDKICNLIFSDGNHYYQNQNIKLFVVKDKLKQISNDELYVPENKKPSWNDFYISCENQ